MRGRTNIPPRVGGIVNGIITECTVAENSGINVGDYVQLVKGTPIRSETSKQVTNAWAYGPFELSDGSFVTFRYFNKVLYSDVTVLNSLGIVSEYTSVVGSTTQQPTSTGYGTVNIGRISDDKFLLLISNYNDKEFAIIERVGDGWTLTELSYSWSFTDKVVGAILCMVSPSKFVLGFNAATEAKLAVGEISGSSVSVSDVITVSSVADALTNFSLSFLEFVNGYVLAGWSTSYSGMAVTFSLTGTTLSQVSTGSVISAVGAGVTKLTENKVLVLYQDRDLYYSSQDGYMKSYIISVDSNGFMSISVDKEAIYFDISGTKGFKFSGATSCILSGGRILVIAVRTLRSGSSSYSYNGDVYYSIGEYDSSSETVSFNEFAVLDSKYLLSSYETTGSRVMYLKPIETEDGLIWFSAGLCDYNSSTSYRYVKYDFITKIEQDTAIGLTEKPLVKKYSNRINGVAKTSGVYGSTIEVYAPSTLL